MKPHAVVIGAGFGGLAAGLRLLARGYRVTICDRLDQPGGRAAVHRQDGFRFDAGPTIITAPFLFEDLFALFGKRMADYVTLRALDPCYTIRFDDGWTFQCRIADEAMLAEVAKLSPGDLEGYAAYQEESRRCFKVGFEGLVDRSFGSPLSMLKALPQLVARRADRSVHGLVARYIRDERLRMALSFHPLFIGGHPFRTSALYSLISHLERAWGVHYARGGTGALVAALASLFQEEGGLLRLGAEVEEVLVERDAAAGVRLVDGEILAAHVVVSNAEAAHTYRRLLPAGRARRRWGARKLDRARQSMSLFIWYFGTSRQWPELGHHTILMGPRYRGLLDDIFLNKVLAEDFSVYLYRPTASDPSAAPEGCDAFYVLSPVPNLDADIDWQREAEPYRRKIAARLEATVLPGLSASVVTSRVTTPLDFRDRLLSEKGAAFGLEPVLTQTAWFRPHNRSEELDNFFLVGAGTHPGAGLPGVISSAKILDEVVPDASAFH